MQRRGQSSTGSCAGGGRIWRWLAYLAGTVALAAMLVPASAAADPDDAEPTGEIEQKLAEAGCVS